MKRIGVIGLGDMGSGIAKNLIKNGFETVGFDLSEQRMATFTEFGGIQASSAKEVGEGAEIVYIMVMNGNQSKSVIFDNGLTSSLKSGSIIIHTATIRTREMIEIAEQLNGSGIELIDSPVSGGFPGAQSGTLTMMAAAKTETMNKARPAMEAVSKAIFHVGSDPGVGQTVKACLQSIIGAIFSSVFEASVLAAKAGVKGQVLYDVVTSSGAGCGVSESALANIINREFVGTGSHINTMHKDLTIALDLARDLGVPLFTASTAMQLFQAGHTKYPEGDNWVVTRVLEEIIDAELHR